MATVGTTNMQAKLVLLGDMGAGKSSLVLRFVKGQFQDFQESTIGAAFFSQTVAVNETTVKFEIWDTAGQERYHSLAPMYYRGAAAAIIVFDITNTLSVQRLGSFLAGFLVCIAMGWCMQSGELGKRIGCSIFLKFLVQDSFVRAKKWVLELQKQGNANLVMALAGNKSDLASKRKVESEEAKVYAEENGLFYLETSAKSAQNVNELFYEIARKLPKAQPIQPPSGMLLSDRPMDRATKSSCCS